MDFGSNPRRVWAACQALMRNAEERGGIEAVIQDVKMNYGLDLTAAQVRNIMCCGGVVVMMAIAQTVSAGVMKVDRKRLQEVLDEEDGAGAPKSEAKPEATEDPTITLEAERAAADAIARIRKLH